ncbi:hypothetical protein Tco_0626143 [Tanacetum coccineum]|uniref:Uncharacterized protein n=1 Tax=Tanacetum coccineum TaxID=301880 RepID=A0ABQ4WIS1_9ASTR
MMFGKVIRKCKFRERISIGKDGVVRILPPVSAAEIHAVEKERKARTILLMAIPKEHLRRFWKWTMQKNMGSYKGLGLVVPKTTRTVEDANHKFLRSLPLAWLNLAMTMRTKPDVDTLSIDDLYNNLRVFEQELTSTSKPTARAQNVAFVSTQQVYADEVIYSLFVKQSEDLDLLHEDLEQIDDLDIEWTNVNTVRAIVILLAKWFILGHMIGNKDHLDDIEECKGGILLPLEVAKDTITDA